VWTYLIAPTIEVGLVRGKIAEMSQEKDSAIEPRQSSETDGSLWVGKSPWPFSAGRVLLTGAGRHFRPSNEVIVVGWIQL
jgi:hypothetical protein